MVTDVWSNSTPTHLRRPISENKRAEWKLLQMSPTPYRSCVCVCVCMFACMLPCTSAFLCMCVFYWHSAHILYIQELYLALAKTSSIPDPKPKCSTWISRKSNIWTALEQKSPSPANQIRMEFSSGLLFSRRHAGRALWKANTDGYVPYSSQPLASLSQYLFVNFPKTNS